MPPRPLAAAVAAAALALAPVAAAAQPLPARAGAQMEEANNQIGGAEIYVALLFVLFVIGVFLIDERGDDEEDGATSP